MKKLYYDIENEEYITEKEIRTKHYIPYHDKGESFAVFLNNCMSYNNGTLQPIEHREKELKKELAMIDNIDAWTIDDVVNIVLQLQELYDFIERNEE